MIEKNEYFVPQIEDIRVGYECERRQYASDSDGSPNFRWIKQILSLNDIQRMDEERMSQGIMWHGIRVPYLTKEQIEAEGWKHLSDTTFPGWLGSSFEKDNYLIGINFIEQIPFIGITFRDPSKCEPPYFDTWRCSFPCKSINEFRYIYKLLNIK